MAELRSSVCVLEDASTQAGLPLHKVLEGDLAAAKNALAALAAKRLSSGVLKYLSLDDSDALRVTIDSSGQANLLDQAEVSGTTSFQTLAELPLTNDASYSKIVFHGSCSRNAKFEVVQIDDTGGTPVETIHLRFRTGAGQLNAGDELDQLRFTAGSTGTCVLRMRAKLTDPSAAATDIDGTLAALEMI